MLSTIPFEVPGAQMAAALERGRKRAAVVGADTEVALASVRSAEQAGLIEPVLVGNAPEMRRMAKRIGWSLNRVEVIGVDDERQATA